MSDESGLVGAPRGPEPAESDRPSTPARYAALVRLLVRHGRSDLVRGAGLGDPGDAGVPAEDGPGVTDRAVAFADDLEAMGPTYIKLGQLLSTRHDLIPVTYATALSRLQDQVEPVPFEVIEQVVQEEFGVGIRHLFADFDPTPLASASIGQVHRARTVSGKDVVVKVQRPDAKARIEDDLGTLSKLAELADSRTEVGRTYGFSALLGQFRRSLMGELDYLREARNLHRFGELLEDYDRLVVPGAIDDLTRPRVLTMERIEGRRVTDIGPLGLLDLDSEEMVEQLFAAYLHLMLEHGVLHADPHPGNLMVTDDGRLALLDLGMVTSLGPRLRDRIVHLLVALGDGDGESAAQVLAGMGHPLPTFDAARFRDEVSHLVTEAMASGPDVQTGTVVMELLRLSGAHGLRPPAEMSLVGKALLNLDRATLHLDPGFAPAEAIRANTAQILRGGLSVSPSGLIEAALEAKDFTAQLPRRANRILEALAEGEFHVSVDAFDEPRLHVVLQRVANRITLGLVLAALIVGAAMALRIPSTTTIWGYPALAIVLFLLAVLAGAYLVGWILIADRKERKP